MKNLKTKIQKIFRKARVVASFQNGSHCEFILLNQENQNTLIWLPTTMGICVSFPLPMAASLFIKQFEALPLNRRLSYIIEFFIETQFKDLNESVSFKLQRSINTQSNGLH